MNKDEFKVTIYGKLLGGATPTDAVKDANTTFVKVWDKCFRELEKTANAVITSQNIDIAGKNVPLPVTLAHAETTT